jgi:hypothetical protein
MAGQRAFNVPSAQLGYQRQKSVSPKAGIAITVASNDRQAFGHGSILLYPLPTRGLQRWNLKLERFDIKTIYKPGSQHTNCDALSRLEIGQ